MQDAQRENHNGKGSGMGEGEGGVNTLLGDTQGAVMGGVVNPELGAEDIIIEKTLLSIQEKVCLAQGCLAQGCLAQGCLAQGYIDSCLLDKILATCYSAVVFNIDRRYI